MLTLIVALSLKWTRTQAKNKKYFAVNAISKQHTFIHFFIVSEWVKFFLKIIDLMFSPKVEKAKITQLVFCEKQNEAVYTV